MKYAVVIEQGGTSFGAWVPDLPGCIAVGESRKEVVPTNGPDTFSNKCIRPL